jgi:hypothetical protein
MTNKRAIAVICEMWRHLTKEHEKEALKVAVRALGNNGWQPIETAPISNTIDCEHPIMLWSPTIQGDFPVFGYYYGNGIVGAHGCLGHNFTHWQPLPKPPCED